MQNKSLDVELPHFPRLQFTSLYLTTMFSPLHKNVYCTTSQDLKYQSQETGTLEVPLLTRNNNNFKVLCRKKGDLLLLLTTHKVTNEVESFFNEKECQLRQKFTERQRQVGLPALLS